MRGHACDLAELLSAARWRQPDQVRALMRNHVDVDVASASLAASNVFFTSASLALHSSEDAAAVALTPLLSAGSVGLLSLSTTALATSRAAGASAPSLAAVPRMRWLDFADGMPASSVAWCDALLFVGSSRGRVLVADVDAAAVDESSGVFAASGALVTHSSDDDVHVRGGAQHTRAMVGADWPLSLTSALPVGQRAVPPSAPAATSLMRGVSVNASVNKSHVLALQDAHVFMWDLNYAAHPVRSWAPHHTQSERSPVLFAAWAPQSDSVVLSGAYDGSLLLVDTRTAHRNAMQLGARAHYAVSCGAFNPLLPFVVAAASSDGTYSIFDVRNTTRAVYTMASLQGDVTALQWLQLNADVLVTAGSDGSVCLWNVRAAPTYCVGRAQYAAPMSALATTRTFAEQRSLGLTVAGTLTLTGLHRDALAALAPVAVTASSPHASSSSSSSPSSSAFVTAAAAAAAAQAGPRGRTAATARPGECHGEGGVTQACDAADEANADARVRGACGMTATASQQVRDRVQRRERQACGSIYTRALADAYEQLLRCAEARVLLCNDAHGALQLVSLVDVVPVPPFSYDAWLRGARDDVHAALPPQAPDAPAEVTSTRTMQSGDAHSATASDGSEDGTDESSNDSNSSSSGSSGSSDNSSSSGNSDDDEDVDGACVMRGVRHHGDDTRASAAARAAFDATMLFYAGRLCSTLSLRALRDTTAPAADVVRRLESLRVNLVLRHLRDVATTAPQQVGAGLSRVLELLTAHPDSFAQMEVDVACDVVVALLQHSRRDGEGLVRFLLTTLLRRVAHTTRHMDAARGGSDDDDAATTEAVAGGDDGVVATHAARVLARRLMDAVQRPRFTDDVRSRDARRLEQRFYRDLDAAVDAVLTQLHVLRLAADVDDATLQADVATLALTPTVARDVLRVMTEYQNRCIARRQPGMFAWLAVRPLVVYLHSLVTGSNYVTFFWACVQLIDAYARFPRVHALEAVLYGVLQRIHTAAAAIAEDLVQLSELDRFALPALRHVARVLDTTHSFVAVLLRVQLECERVALDSGLRTQPPLMTKVQDVLNGDTEATLEAWAALLEALSRCEQTTLVRRHCAATTRSFAMQVEDLLDVSAKRDADERLNAILDVCDDFMDALTDKR